MVMAQVRLEEVQAQCPVQLFPYRVWFEREVPRLKRSVHSLVMTVAATCVSTAKIVYAQEMKRVGIHAPTDFPDRIKAVRVHGIEPNTSWLENAGAWAKCGSCKVPFPVEQLNDPDMPGICSVCRAALGSVSFPTQPTEIIGADPLHLGVE